MASAEPFSTAYSVNDGLTINGAAKMSAGDLSVNHHRSNEQNILEKFYISGDNQPGNEVSSHGIGSINTAVGGVVLNNIEGVVAYIPQEVPTHTAMNINNMLEFDFNTVNSSNESQPTFVGNANLYNVPTSPRAANIVSSNNQIYLYNDILKVASDTNNQAAIIQPEIHAIAFDQVLVNQVAPLGSSQNPIRIVQQGNQYTPLQSLSPEQLAQVMKVVEQQQQQILSDDLSGHGQASVLFTTNPDPQAKMAYKVCYPSQMMGTASNHGSSAISNASSTDLFAHQKKKIEAIDVLMRLDKEHKKKHRPRTRCGRVSKPPQYMVKDYKHIHPVDYDEDYDDSDGGYSDFKLSSGEEEGTNKNNLGNNSLAYASLKSKRFKCECCEKSYIGKGGLNRHYKLNPSHGKPDDEANNEQGDSFYSSDSFQSGVLASGSGNGEGNPARSKRTRFVSDDNVTLALEVFPNGESKQKDAEVVYSSNIRRGRRGRPPVLNAIDKKRQRLQEVSRLCSDEDILELFIQRCSYTVSLWDVLSLKNTKVYDSNVDSLLSEVSNLHEQISTYLSERLLPLAEDENCEEECNSSNKNVFEMVDEKLAVCLNLPVGKYTVKPEAGSENSIQSTYPSGSEFGGKFSKDLPASSFSKTSVTSYDAKPQEPEQSIALPPRKRLKLSETSFGSKDHQTSTYFIGNDNIQASSSTEHSSNAFINTSQTVEPQVNGNNYALTGNSEHQLIASSGFSFGRQHSLISNEKHKRVKSHRSCYPSTMSLLGTHDDMLVTSSSHLTDMLPNGGQIPGNNVVSDTGFAKVVSCTSEVPGVDSSVQSASSHNALSDLWPDLTTFAKTTIEHQMIDPGRNQENSFVSFTMPNSVSGSHETSVGIDASAMRTCHNYEAQQQDLTGASSSENNGDVDQLALQLPAVSYSTVPEASQSQQISVTCYPMQEFIQIQENARYVQTEDGLLIVKNPDGSFQIYGNLTQNLTLDMLESVFVN